MPWVLTCTSPDMRGDPPVDCASGQHWEQLEMPPASGSLLPDLTLEDAAEIGVAIAFLWAIAFAWREIRRAVSSTDSGD